MLVSIWEKDVYKLSYIMGIITNDVAIYGDNFIPTDNSNNIIIAIIGIVFITTINGFKKLYIFLFLMANITINSDIINDITTVNIILIIISNNNLYILDVDNIFINVLKTSFILGITSELLK